MNFSSAALEGSGLTVVDSAAAARSDTARRPTSALAPSRALMSMEVSVSQESDLGPTFMFTEDP